MSGVGEAALDTDLYGNVTGGPPLFIQYCGSVHSRPKLNPLDQGLIYDREMTQVLRWNVSRWERRDGTPVRTLPFPQIEPKFADVPRMGVGVTCIPGAWAGFPAPTFDFTWFVDGVLYNGFRGANPLQFGGNADELAFLKEGREIQCRVGATMPPEAGNQWPYRAATFGQAISYIRPALPA
jgi:hypothetical protein